MKKGRPQKVSRNMQIVLMVKAGMSFRDVAQKLKMSHVSVYTIYKRDQNKYQTVDDVATVMATEQ